MKTEQLTTADAHRAARAFRLRASAEQVAAFLRLAEGPATLGTLAAEFGRSGETARRYVAPLVWAGLVEATGTAKARVYRLTDEGARILGAVRAQEGVGP